MLNARAIAVQGIGYTPRLVAVQGLWEYSVAPPSDVPLQPSPGGAGWRFRKQVDKTIGVDFRVQNEVVIATVVSAVTSGIIQ